jgi:peptide/nickel transport system permease protein
VITFVLINLAPGDPITAQVNPEELNALSAEQVAAMREDLGLNQPVLIRYVTWLGDAIRGDLGESFHYERGVLDVILEKLPATLMITATSMLLASVIGVSLGIFSAVRQYSIFDHILTILAFFGVSVPGFFFALIGMYIFSVKLGWLPVFGMWTPGEPTGFNWDLIQHAILPVLTLTLPQIAGYMRYARAATLEVLGADYVTTARAKGLKENVILRRHVIRNSMLPLVTIFGLSIPNVISGSFIVESIFSWPGIGLMGYESIRQSDYPMQIGIALMAATIVLLANLFTDVAYGLVDPRIRHE